MPPHAWSPPKSPSPESTPCHPLPHTLWYVDFLAFASHHRPQLLLTHRLVQYPAAKAAARARLSAAAAADTNSDSAIPVDIKLRAHQNSSARILNDMSDAHRLSVRPHPSDPASSRLASDQQDALSHRARCVLTPAPCPPLHCANSRSIRPGAFLRSAPSEISTVESRERVDFYDSDDSDDTQPTSINTLPALQTKGPPPEVGLLEPVVEDDPASYDLVEPLVGPVRPADIYSLEKRCLQIFSREHLSKIFENPALLMKFTTFLGEHRPASVPTLIYYLDALKALRAIRYANAVAEGLDPIEGADFAAQFPPPTRNEVLEHKARQAFDALVLEDLPAYVTHTFIQIVSLSIHRRITGTLPPHLREASEGLAEVFCLSDPSRPDNPIVFASEGSSIDQDLPSDMRLITA